MKREIKFRYWYSNTMLPIGNIEFFTDGSYRVNDECVGGVLMQYTGLKDKNGKEIYESDIIEWIYTNSGKKMVAEVKWKGVGFKPTRLSDRNTFEMKVIGNIYENPELLK